MTEDQEYYYLKPIEPDNQTKVMSNKQEDAERRKRHEIAKRILSDGDEEYKTNCICTLLEAQSELAKERELRKEPGIS